MPATPYLTSLPLIDLDTADDTQKPLLDQALRQVGFVPNMYAAMVNLPAVLSTYLHGYGQFRATSGFEPAEQEVVFLAISMANGCAYCSAAHSLLADKMSNVPPPVLAAIRARREIPDPRLHALHALTRELVLTQGRPGPDAVRAFREAGYQERDVLAIILAIAVKTLSNFTNHAVGTPLDARFASHVLP